MSSFHFSWVGGYSNENFNASQFIVSYSEKYASIDFAAAFGIAPPHNANLIQGSGYLNAATGTYSPNQSTPETAIINVNGSVVTVTSQ